MNNPTYTFVRKEGFFGECANVNDALEHAVNMAGPGNGAYVTTGVMMYHNTLANGVNDTMSKEYWILAKELSAAIVKMAERHTDSDIMAHVEKALDIIESRRVGE